MVNSTQKISPYLWFDKDAEAAMIFYTSTFSNSKIVDIHRYPEGEQVGPMAGMQGKVLNGIFELEGQQFMALDGGPLFAFNPSISFMVNCTSKEELDGLWEKLSAGGKALMPLDSYPFSERYGWVADQYGLSWQLILSNPDGDERPKITPSMMFVGDNTGKAEEAMKFYAAQFNNSKIGRIERYPAGQEPDAKSSVMYGDFTLENQWFAAMDSGQEHDFSFNEAVSFLVSCQTQAEVDDYWVKLSAVPASEQCGWLKDKFGVSWQIIPKQLGELLSDPDPEKSARVMQAMLQMKKIDIKTLQQAYDNEQ